MRKTLLTGVVVLGLAAAAGVATAQQLTAQEPTARQPTERPMRAQRADTDQDGRISRAEFVDRRVQRLTLADANGDGTVSREEMQAQRRAGHQQRAEARFARLDADNDGHLTREEFTAVRAEGARGKRDHARPGRHGPRGAHAGARNPRESVVIADAQAKTAQAFARLDADNDGFITAGERRAGMRSSREQRRERMVERRAAREASPQTPASE